ncbi:protein spaetzle 4 [Anopheles ziemanni]|uniref:protein spaetzle 4 n=1 Tax=Anopheles coustani TaxID=139045 RepID=UPI00265946AB|nr:protein spaetzle 4 [Anopheles coustani]XP_058167635.1 protein spaetzle 4 [Anopheles ziemanni]
MALCDRSPCWQTRSLLAWCILSSVALIVLLPLSSIAESYGYDSASSCDPTRASRRGRSQLLKTIPCDLSVQAYCNLPGSAYPWHAVRRFVHENQGLMRRMYGDVRHISVLKEEFENNEIEIDDIDRATERYSRPQAADGRDRRVDGGKRMKYLRPSAPQHYDGLGHYLRDKSNEIPLNEPHFRPAQLKTTTTTRTVTPATVKTTLSRSEVPSTATATTTTTSTTTKPMPRTTKGALTTTSRSTSTATTVESPPRTPLTTASAGQPITSTQSPVKNEPTELESFKDASGTKNQAESSSNAGVDSTTEGTTTLLVTNNVAEDTSKVQLLEGETIDMEALSSLAKLEMSEAMLTSAEPEEKDIGEDKVLGGKISTTLKLSASVPQLAAKKPEPDALSSSAKVEEIQSTVSSNSHDRQDFVPASEPSESVLSKDIEEGDPGKSANNVAAEPLAQEDSVASSSTIQPQKIRFESIKGGAAGTPAVKKPNAEGQLFQDVAQKEPPVVNGRGVNACPVKEEVVAPFWANNTRGEVLALLNLYPFEQYVHWEKCTHELKQMYCREGCRCEQQYRLHRLLAYDPHNECRGIFSDWFRFPSCCICKCYDMPFDFRVTSRSPRSLTKESIELMEDELQNAIYEHATDEWYRPKEHDFD